ncbi:MAB_1171c family putative transporter [Actinoplanes sp. GCM10030250]|uniref:MAB_1171c family putative transporter n=1 Tax=Actinoplanes sp. GCM10030250 TaxID=3273376 RepID=UPI00360F370B
MLAVGAALWVIVLARLPGLRRDHRQRVLWASFLACALAVSLAAPAIRAGRDVPVAAHLCGVTAAFLLLRFISLVTGTGRGRAQLALLGAVLIAMTVLAARGIATTPPRLTAGITPAQMAYWTVFEGYLAVVVALCARACLALGRSAPRGMLRVGLVTMGAGLSLISAYAGSTVILVDLRGSGLPLDFGQWQPWTVAVRRTGVVLYLAGGSVPAAARLRTVLGAYRTLLVLRPLWSAMRRAFPQMVLWRPARSAVEARGVAGVRLRLYRRVIEIRDGMLALRDFLPADAAQPHNAALEDAALVDAALDDAALEDAAPEDAAVAEARAIVLALRRRAAGEPPADPPGRWAPVGPDMADEIAWLSRVSAAFRDEQRRGAGDLSPCRGDARTPRPAGSAR